MLVWIPDYFLNKGILILNLINIFYDISQDYACYNVI